MTELGKFLALQLLTASGRQVAGEDDAQSGNRTEFCYKMRWTRQSNGAHAKLMIAQ